MCLPTSVDNFGFADTASCTLGLPLANAVSNPSSCKIENNKITIVNIYGVASVAAGEQIRFSISNMNNPYSVEDVGTFEIETYEVYEGVNYLIDNGTKDGVYSA